MSKEDLTTFQRLRDAAVRNAGIHMDAQEVADLFEREGDQLLNHARDDDALAFGAPEDGPGEDEIEGEPDLGGLSAVSGD